MKINQIIINELSESAQPGVATTAAQTPQAQAAAQAIQKGLAVLQQQLPNFDASFNTTDAIQEIMPDGTVVMDSNLQPSALQNVRKILALGGGANFKVTMSTQTIPSATGQQVALQAKPGKVEESPPFRGVGGAFNRGDDERHDLDPTDWYIVKDGKMLVASIYPRQTQQALAQGFSRTRAEAKSRDNSQGVAEGSLNELSSDLLKRSAQAATDKRNQAMDPELHNALGGGYMNPLATHYDNVSQKMDNRAAQVRKKETIQKIASKIASPAVMRKMGMSDMEEGVAENTATGINKMFNNLGDPVYSNLQRVALLAMQGRQSEAAGRLQSVIKDASTDIQKKITDAVNNIKPVTINGKIADSSTLDKSKQHNDWIINTFIPWVQSLLGKQGVAEASNTMQRYGQTIIKRARAARAAEQAARAAEPEPKKEEPPASSDYSSMSTRDYRTMMQQLKKPKNKNVAAAPDYMEENIKRQ